MPRTRATSTVQIYIVVVNAATDVATTVQKYIVRKGRKGGITFNPSNNIKIGYIQVKSIYYIYSNQVPFVASQKSYELKSSIKFGSS